MNFLPAKSAGDGSWSRRRHRRSRPATASGEIEFAIRPEDVEVAPGGVPATVRVVEPLGAHTLVTADVDGRLFRAVLEIDMPVPSPATSCSLGAAGPTACAGSTPRRRHAIRATRKRKRA